VRADLNTAGIAIARPLNVDDLQNETARAPEHNAGTLEALLPKQRSKRRLQDTLEVRFDCRLAKTYQRYAAKVARSEIFVSFNV
jgi:hypothetical protein